MASPTISPQSAVTPKQLQVLVQIGNFQKNRCYFATIGELAQTLRISRPTAYEHIAALREKKLLAQSTGKARCLKLSAHGEKLLDQKAQCEAFDEVPASSITLRGRVSAGYGIDAIEENRPFSLSEVYGDRGDLFALQVCGRSMIDAGICDGDYVICRQSAAAENGQLVVALLDDGENATLKRFFRDKDAVRLQPENDAFEPILSRHCRIQAVVVGLVRRF